ncbi:MAG TPA: hypothetical protein VIM79_09550 [Niastella sp.]
MKLIITIVFLTSCLVTFAQAPLSATNAPFDTTLAKKITVAGFCLCHTTVSQLRNLDSDLQEIAVEEMDMCNDGFAEDARFVNRKGYYSKKYPGIIFQKSNDDDHISKIRLTKGFTGSLPDGTPIDMKTLTAKDVLKVYPQFDTWRSRGCSDYWNLTNDTLSFFVKIDKTKQPQYPVDEAYYSTRPIEGIDLVISCYSVFKNAEKRHKPEQADPVFFIDSVHVSKRELEKYQPTEIATLTVYKDSNAIKLIGEQGKYGVIYIETKKFARNRYWQYLKHKSPEYAKAVPSPEKEDQVVYIINGKIQANPEGSLATINDSNFIDLKVVGAAFLKKTYGIRDRKYGIVINANIGK